jgi:uncharacterized glyoxalase superfamily protein PhnB
MAGATGAGSERPYGCRRVARRSASGLRARIRLVPHDTSKRRKPGRPPTVPSIAQLAVGEAAFWVAAAGAEGRRFSLRAMGGATSRTLLVADDPDAVVQWAIDAGATGKSRVCGEHGWRLGRIVDPFGHEWEIGKPIGHWPPP